MPSTVSRVKQILAYLVSGGLAAGTNFGSRFLFSLWLPFEAAVVLAYFCGMVVGFTLMRRYAFTHGKAPMHHQMMGYCLVNLAGVVQAVVVSSLMLRWVFPRMFDSAVSMEPWAHLVGIAVPAVSSYFGHRFVTFR